MPGRPRSRPMPLSLMPPVGACTPPMNQPLIQTEPASMSRAMRSGARMSLAVDAGDEAVAEPVGERHRLVRRLEVQRDGDRPEDLFAGDHAAGSTRSKIVGATK